jgi:8-oxo-dGTP pyrophosphatase MutT (NUDIX family)
VDGQDYHVTLVGGGVETGESNDIAVLRELEEEAGIVVNEEYQLESLKPLFKVQGGNLIIHSTLIIISMRWLLRKKANRLK